MDAARSMTEFAATMARYICTRPVEAAERVVDGVTGDVSGGDQAAAFCSRSRFQFQGSNSSMRLAG
jgi:hypothetical protein